jgi:hypothetical protein
MRIILLDLDGVLLPLPSDSHFEPELKPSINAVNNLNLMIQITNAQVVVTSHWRNGRTVEQLTTLLRSWGVKWGVFGKTRDAKGEEDRGALISDWLANSREVIDAFVVIDDERTDLEQFARQLVSPKPDVGLQFHDVQEAVRILVK